MNLKSYEPSFEEGLKVIKNTISTSRREINLDNLAMRIDHMAKSGGGVSKVDLERYINDNDLVPINYLQRGLLAAKAVCRIYVPNAFGTKGEWGTGFMISPNLLITNNHVLPDADAALRASAEFEYQADLKGNIRQGKIFTLRPDLGFITKIETELDYTIVAVSETSEDGKFFLSEYGFLRLIPTLNKIEQLEYVTVIQHPNGNEKLIAIRENKVIKIGDDKDVNKENYMWYASDTARGSSGAPAFNDNWQVVAIHHSAVPESRKRLDNGQEVTEYQLLSGEWIDERLTKDDDDIKVKYIANEGVRVSKIVADTIQQYEQQSVATKEKYLYIKQFIDDANGVKSFPTTTPGESINRIDNGESLSINLERTRTGSGRNERSIEYYDGRKGYDENFLGIKISLPTISKDTEKELGKVCKLINSEETELKYTHFSVVMNEDRKLAYCAAVNIDGKKWINMERGSDKWFFDPRIPRAVQVDNIFYTDEPVNGKKGWFDRGHLVRRLDPVWGKMDVAALANEDTFHWTNCSPQYWGFNQGEELWQGLENYILYNTDEENVKACVFNGPIFHNGDENHRDVKIPKHFWKVVAVIDGDGKLYVSAYVVTQKKYAQNIPFEVLPVEDFNNFQVSLLKLQKDTGLTFPDILHDNDVRKGLPDKGLRSLADIEMGPRRGKRESKSAVIKTDVSINVN